MGPTLGAFDFIAIAEPKFLKEENVGLGRRSSADHSANARMVLRALLLRVAVVISVWGPFPSWAQRGPPSGEAESTPSASCPGIGVPVAPKI